MDEGRISTLTTQCPTSKVIKYFQDKIVKEQSNHHWVGRKNVYLVTKLMWLSRGGVETENSNWWEKALSVLW